MKIDFIDTMNKYGRANLPFLFIINFDFSDAYIQKLSDIDSNEISYKINSLSNFKNEDIPSKDYTIKKFPESIYEYKSKFDKVRQHLFYGNSYLTNLTCKTRIEINLSLKEIFRIANATYKLFFKDKFVCFSPECFIKVIDNKVFTYPMKGTISAAVPNALNVILNDEKELQEHNTIVDLLRNDLSIVSENVKVTKFRFPSYIKTKDKELIQISSEICGELPQNWNNNIGDLLAAILPAGSVSGAPKKRTVEIIKSCEDYERGYYTGVFGIFDGKNLDSAVSIRFIEMENGILYYKSGGGITINSDLNSEYNEMTDKIYVPVN